MTPEQEASLVSVGDCRTHWHSEDRQPTQDFLRGLQTVANQKAYSGTITLTGKEDFVLVDTSTGNSTLTLPRAVNGLEIEIMKLDATNTITVLPEGTDTILLNTGATISVGGASIRFKAIGTDWRPI